MCVYVYSLFVGMQYPVFPVDMFIFLCLVELKVFSFIVTLPKYMVLTKLAQVPCFSQSIVCSDLLLRPMPRPCRRWAFRGGLVFCVPCFRREQKCRLCLQSNAQFSLYGDECDHKESKYSACFLDLYFELIICISSTNVMSLDKILKNENQPSSV